MSLQWKFTVFTLPDLLGVGVDHLLTVGICIQEFIFLGQGSCKGHIPLCASYPQTSKKPYVYYLMFNSIGMQHLYHPL